MSERPISVTSIINFPEKPWMAAWVVKLMKGEYEAWEKGTEPAEVRLFAQQIGSLFHVLVQKELGFAVTPKLLNAANKATMDEQIATRSYNSLALWQQWYTKEPRKFQGVEIDLSDAELGISGRCDAIMLENGKRVVIDWKTGGELHESDALELSAYCWLASRKFRYPVVRGLLVHCPYEGNAVHVVELAEPGIVKGAATFEALLQAKTRWSDWSLFCSTGIKLGGSQ
jgi:hypothetical protein